MPGTILGHGRLHVPRAAARPESADHRSDLFSTGAVLYEMLVRALAVRRRHRRRHRERDPEPGSRAATNATHRRRASIESCCDASRRSPPRDSNRRRDLAFALENLSRVGHDCGVRAREDVDERRSIAVLPFVDMSPGKDHDYFCVGMAEEIMNALTGIAGLRVAARSSAFRFKGGDHDLQAVGRALDVKTVLEGSVRTAGNRLRVTAQLNRVEGGFQLWSRRYDRELNDVFAIQDEIAADIVDALRLELTEAPMRASCAIRRTRRPITCIFAAGITGIQRTKEALAKAREHYEQAVAKDPATRSRTSASRTSTTSRASTASCPSSRRSQGQSRPGQGVCHQRSAGRCASDARIPAALLRLGFDWGAARLRAEHRARPVERAVVHLAVVLCVARPGRSRVARVSAKAQRARSAEPLHHQRRRRDSRLLGPDGRGDRRVPEGARCRCQLPACAVFHWRCVLTGRQAR